MSKKREMTLQVFMNSRFRNPLIILFLIAYVIITVLDAFSTFRAMFSHLEYVATDMEKEMSYHYHRMDIGYRRMLLIWDLELSEDEKWAFMEKVVDQDPSIAGIHYIDDRGMVERSYPRNSLLEGNPLPNMEGTTFHYSGLHYSNAIKDDLSGKVIVNVTQSEASPSKFVVSYEVPLENYVFTKNERRFILAFMNDKAVLASSRPLLISSNRNYSLNSLYNFVMAEKRTERSYSLVSTVNQGWMIQILAPVKMFGWTSAIYYPVKVVVQQLLHSIFVLTVVFLLLLMLQRLLGQQLVKITKPILELNEAFGDYAIENFPDIDTAVSEINELNHGIARLNENLKQRDKEIKDFVFMTAHDLQEPLRTISSYINLLKEDFIDHLPKEAEELMDLIMAASRRLSKMVKGLLVLTKIEEKGDMESIPLNRLVATIILGLEQVIREKNATILVHQLPTIDAYEHHVSTLFQNLIENALKYSKGDARIEIGEEEGWVYVKDNGIGIDEIYFDDIFKPFVRLHSNMEYEGTGLGLPSVKRVVNLNQWGLKVNSAVGLGTTFSIKFHH